MEKSISIDYKFPLVSYTQKIIKRMKPSFVALIKIELDSVGIIILMMMMEKKLGVLGKHTHNSYVTTIKHVKLHTKMLISIEIISLISCAYIHIRFK
jgi:hypothetical protein